MPEERFFARDKFFLTALPAELSKQYFITDGRKIN